MPESPVSQGIVSVGVGLLIEVGRFTLPGEEAEWRDVVAAVVVDIAEEILAFLCVYGGGGSASNPTQGRAKVQPPVSGCQ
jgi:hypothetical protein